MRLYKWTKAYADNDQVAWLPEGERPDTPAHHATGLPYGEEEWSDEPDGYVDHEGIYPTDYGYAIALPIWGSGGKAVPMSIDDAIVTHRLRLRAG